jgi:KTSC domain
MNSRILWIMPSSVVSAIHYYPATSTLRVVFVSGMVYDYKNVPEKVYKEMKASPSKGTYLNQHIKGLYGFKKVN